MHIVRCIGEVGTLSDVAADSLLLNILTNVLIVAMSFRALRTLIFHKVIRQGDILRRCRRLAVDQQCMLVHVLSHSGMQRLHKPCAVRVISKLVEL